MDDGKGQAQPGLYQSCGDRTAEEIYLLIALALA
jgi:hypothetical protein